MLATFACGCGSDSTGAGGDEGAAAPPSIQLHPSNQSVEEGRSAFFFVHASGDGTLQYQWEKSSDGGESWNVISGATGYSHTHGFASINDDGASFRCAVTNEGGTVRTNAAVLTVTPGSEEFPVIRTQPADRTVARGRIARFEIELEGSGEFAYWWQKSADGTSWQNVPGGDSTLDYGPVAMTDHKFLFRVVAAHESGLFLTSDPAQLSVASVIFVDAEASGAFDGTSWADAFDCLQEALAAVNFGQEIWVAGGTYTPTTPSDPNDARTASFGLVERVAVYGGFAGTEDARELRDWKANETVLSGDIDGDGELVGNSYHVVIGADQARLDGFTVTGGNADILDIILDMGVSLGGGGGMLVTSGTPTVANCVFRDNHGIRGGVLLVYASGLRVERCVFLGNSAQMGGTVGAISSSVWFIDSEFLVNSADTGGAVIAEMLSAARFVNCVFVGNSAEEGGAVYGSASAGLRFLNCCLISNTATARGGAMAIGEQEILGVGDKEATNTIFLDNSAPEGSLAYMYWGELSFLNSNLQPHGLAGVGGNLRQVGGVEGHPLFFRPPAPGSGGWGSPDDDYGDLRLHWESPCIDAGTNDPYERDGWAEGVETDAAGAPRVGGDTVDVGVYEHRWMTYVGPAELYFAVQPDPSTVEVGEEASFFAHAIGPDAVAHRWQRWDVTGGAWGDIPDATGLTYSLETTLADAGARFRCAAVDGAAETFSDEVALTVLALPGAFGLLSPGAAEALEDNYVDVQPTFEWQSADGATSYVLTIFRGEGELVLEKTGLAATQYSPTEAERLEPETQYGWRVVAHNDDGSRQCEDDFCIFTIPNPPDPFELASPSDGEAEVGLTPTFHWNADAVFWNSYTIIVSKSPLLSDPVVLEEGIGNTSFSLAAPLEYDTTYYWSVTAHNPGGSTVCGSDFSFTTTPDYPGPFSLESPVMEQVSSLRPAFVWGESVGASSYDLLIATDMTFTQIVQEHIDINVTSFTLTDPLDQLAVYWWRVVAKKDGGGALNCEEDFWFETPLVAPGGFDLLSPNAFAGDVPLSPTFTWAESQDAQSYTLLVALDEAFEQVVLSEYDITGTSYVAAATLQTNTCYWWRVVAQGLGGLETPCAADFSFTTAVVAAGDLEFVVQWTGEPDRTIYFVGNFNDWDIGGAPAMGFSQPTTSLVVNGAVDGPFEFMVSNDTNWDCWDWATWNLQGQPESHAPYVPSGDTTLLRVDAAYGEIIRIVIDVDSSTVTVVLEP